MSAISNLILTGYNPATSATAQPIWGVTGTQYIQLTTGTALEAVSSSANDAAAGTGARTIRVEGVDANYVPFAETVTLDGATPVALANTSVIAVNNAYVLTAGSGLTNAGNVDIRAVTGSLIKRRIQAVVESRGEASDFVYTMPASRYGLMKRIQVYCVTSTGSVWVYLKFQSSTGLERVKFTASTSLDVTAFSNGKIDIDFGNGLYVPEKTLVTLIVDMTAGTPLVSAVGQLEIHAS